MKKIFVSALLGLFVAIVVACNNINAHGDVGSGAITSSSSSSPGPTLYTNQVIVSNIYPGGTSADFEFDTAEESSVTYTAYMTPACTAVDINNYTSIVDAATLATAVNNSSLSSVASGVDVSVLTVDASGVRGGCTFSSQLIIIAASFENGATSIYYPKGHIFVSDNLEYVFPMNPSKGINTEDVGPGTVTLDNGFGGSDADRYGFEGSALDLSDNQILQSGTSSSTDVIYAGLGGDFNKTLTFWMKASSSSVASIEVPIAFGYGSSSSGGTSGGVFGAYLDTNGFFNFWGYGSNNYTTSFTYDDVWHQWVITYNGTDVSVYRDGVLDGGGAHALTLTTDVSQTDGASITVGTGPTTDSFSTDYFNGDIDDVFIMQENMQQVDVTNFYNVMKVPCCPPGRSERSCRCVNRE